MARYGMVVDLKRCVGLQRLRRWPASPSTTRRTGSLLTTVLEKEMGTFPHMNRVFVPVLCNHCDVPVCAQVCPTKATHKRPDGIVFIEYAKCIGCCACIEHCPYHVRTLVQDNRMLYPDGTTAFEKPVAQQILNKVATKCDLCYHRVEDRPAPGVRGGVPGDGPGVRRLRRPVVEGRACSRRTTAAGRCCRRNRRSPACSTSGEAAAGEGPRDGLSTGARPCPGFPGATSSTGHRDWPRRASAWCGASETLEGPGRGRPASPRDADVIIIGAGLAGIAAAITAADAGASVHRRRQALQNRRLGHGCRRQLQRRGLEDAAGEEHRGFAGARTSGTPTGSARGRPTRPAEALHGAGAPATMDWLEPGHRVRPEGAAPGLEHELLQRRRAPTMRRAAGRATSRCWASSCRSAWRPARSR